MEAIKLKYGFKNKIYIITIIVLLIVVGVLFIDKQNLKWDLILYRCVPHIGLTNTLNDSLDGDLLYGQVRGFVLFDKEDDQPKNASQYYIIEPLQKLDNNFNQIFSVEEIIVLDSLPPTSIGIWELRQKSESNRIITLKDEEGNQFFIDKTSKEITMKDLTGDSVRLITSDSEYHDFMWNLLKKQY